jgi:hypothetical protein
VSDEDEDSFQLIDAAADFFGGIAGASIAAIRQDVAECFDLHRDGLVTFTDQFGLITKVEDMTLSSMALGRVYPLPLHSPGENKAARAPSRRLRPYKGPGGNFACFD